MKFRIIIISITLVAIGGYALLTYHAPTISIGELTPPEHQEKASPPAEPPPVEPLKNPPEFVKAIYATNWSAGTKKRLNQFIKLIDETELNSIVIDIKDYSGYVGYKTDLEAVKQYKAEEERIADVREMIRELHKHQIYVIGRLSVFQDSRLTTARPDLAVLSSTTGNIWKDRKGITWADQASPEVWDYIIGIAKDALKKGFDEINFDYIRFESDGNISDAVHPHAEGKKTKRQMMKDFFAYVREQLPDAKISADIFGLSAARESDLGIGQYLEDVIPYFDYVAPMMYPSHYGPGFLGYKNPAEAPYEVVFDSVSHALKRMVAFRTSTTTPNAIFDPITGEKRVAKIRPWLQDFDLGAVYTEKMVQDQIKALLDAGSTTKDLVQGYMLWNPSNNYRQTIFQKE
jgi:hypothetical protein